MPSPIGIMFSSEERTAQQMVVGAQRAERAGFTKCWISDHFHPWVDAQGESPFVWSTLAAILATTETLHLHTGVTCPTMRTHPAIVAHAAATTATLGPGRFTLGVGSGEALNEHILGDRWPGADERLEMLEEAVEVIRLLWQGGVQSHRGRHYRVEHARLYSLPEEPTPIFVSGFGPKAVSLAARIGDGFMNVGPAKELVEQYRSEGGKGLTQTSTKVCVGPSRDECIDLAHTMWPNAALPGELAQVLPDPEHFEQAADLVTKEMIAESTPCGPDAGPIIENLQEHLDAGYDEVFVANIGPHEEQFIDVMQREVLPHFA
jgi:G6PDH family F420-dependent oxidoreductase